MTLHDQFAKAQDAFDAGDAEAAASLCDTILATWPGQSDTLHLRGLAAATKGEAEQALRFVRQACAAPEAQALFHSNLAELCRRAGLLVEGEQAARRAVAMQPDLLDAWTNLGIVLQEAGQFVESKACLERVLTRDPDNAAAHNNFANTCKRLNLIGLAERHWLRALDLREHYPEPHSGLSFLLTEGGNYERAAFHARKAIALRPHFADAYLNLALVEAARDDPAAAIAVLDALLAFAPGHATAMAAKALALEQLDRLEEGLAWAERAAAAAPDNAEAVHAFGRLSQAANQIAAARVAFELAMRLPGTAAEKAAGSRAQLLMEIGQSDAASRAFAEALAAYPRSASLYYHRADLKRFSAGDADIAAMRMLLEHGGAESAHDRMLLHFTLGNAFLQLGDGAQAFAHLDEGNRMKRATIRYDSAATLRWMETIAQTFDADALEKLAAQRGALKPPPADVTPVFVIGMPRSGTTLLEQILASHPAVLGAGELNFVAQGIAGHGSFPAMAANLTGADLHGLGSAYMDAVRKRLGADLVRGHRHVVDKMPANFFHAGLIHAMLPQARFIHCRRDPVDTCLSCYSKLFTREQQFSYDQAELGQFHRGYQGLMAHWRRVLPPSHFVEVDYEDVVADLEGQARRMLDVLDLPWSPSCLDFHRTERPVRTASVNQVRQPLYRGSAGRAKRYAAELRPLLAALHQGPEA